jgi:hypothetical protein
MFPQVTFKSDIKSTETAMVLNNFKGHTFYTIKLTQVFIIRIFLIFVVWQYYFQGKTWLTKGTKVKLT